MSVTDVSLWVLLIGLILIVVGFAGATVGLYGLVLGDWNWGYFRDLQDEFVWMSEFCIGLQMWTLIVMLSIYLGFMLNHWMS